MALVDLCVTNYNTSDKLQRLCFELFKGASDMPSGLYNLMVADNGSTNDDSLEMLRTRPPQNISTIVYNDNIGYSAACNQLAAMGKAEIIGLLNSDVWLTSNDVLSICKTFNDHPEIAILGPKQRDEHGNITHAGIEGTEAKPNLRAWKEPDPHDVKYRELKEMVSVSGSAYFIRRSVWDDLTNCGIYRDSHPTARGAFLPTKHYYEETFCSYHARAHGYKVYYDGRISIGHSWHASHEVGSKQDRMFHESREIFRTMCDKHGIEHD